MNVAVVPYEGLLLRAVIATWPRPLGQVVPPPSLAELLRAGAAAPVATNDTIKTAVRDLLRGRGYRPTGRGKPSSEYLAGAAADGRLGPINAAVDCGNAASLHSGLPISIVDVDACRSPLRVDVPAAGSSYVFNRSGQEIDVGGLLCLFDADGPCANAVKDAQRTKTTDASVRVLGIVWGAAAAGAAHVERTAVWLSELLAVTGANVEPAVLEPPA